MCDEKGISKFHIHYSGFDRCFFLSGMNAQAQTKVMPDGGLFDAEYYAAAYPDVVAVLGTSEAALYQHYVTCGRAEGRQGCADFDPVFYAAAYPDVVAAYGYNEAALYQHYITLGRREGRLGVTPGSAASRPENAGVTATSVLRRDTMQVYLNYPARRRLPFRRRLIVT